MGEKKLMKGNEALAEGAVRAGCRFFAGYPITPQNEVPEYMSWRLPEVGGAFIQAESEVSAINMIYGAAGTGTRCMTSSSSPGISLKQEGLSYCAGADLPLLIANMMRGGPGLGNIAGCQGDYWQATRGGGHGDYRLYVVAPNSVNELANLPRKCYEVAFKYRIPSMILADGTIGQMMESVEYKDEPIDVTKLEKPEWAIGTNLEHRAKRRITSYDLTEGGLEIMVKERMQRYKAIEENEVMYEEKYTDDADIVIVAFGTPSRVSTAAIKMLREKDIKVGLLRPITLWPFPYKQIQQLANRVKKFVSVETSMGQMVEDVKLALDGKAETHLYCKVGAAVLTAEEVAAALEEIHNGSTKYAAVK